jgi:hypothetical protein
MDAVFHRSAPSKLLRYTGANRATQRLTAPDSPGNSPRGPRKTRSATPFLPFFAQKTALRARFVAIPFDFQLRLS